MGRPRKKEPVQQHNAAPKHWGGIPSPEDLDPMPMEMPLGATQPESLQSMVARMVRDHVATEKEEEFETFEESEDFEPEDPDVLPVSQYEVVEATPEPIESSDLESPAPIPSDEPVEPSEGNPEASGEPPAQSDSRLEESG